MAGKRKVAEQVEPPKEVAPVIPAPKEAPVVIPRWCSEPGQVCPSERNK